MSLEQTENGKRNLSIRGENGAVMMENSLKALTWKCQCEGWMGNCGSTSLREGRGHQYVHVELSSQMLDVHFWCIEVTSRRSGSSQELQLLNIQCCFQIQVCFLNCDHGIIHVGEGHGGSAQSRFSSGSDCLGLCPVGSWNSQGRRLHSPSGPLLQSLVILKGNKELLGNSSGSKSGLVLFC